MAEPANTGDAAPDVAAVEARLRANERRFRAFIMASSDVVYRMSADWSWMEQLDGQGFLADTHKPTESWMDSYIEFDDRAAVQEAIDQAVRTKSMFELEHRVRRADGSVGWTLSRAVPILDANGEIAEWFGAAKDATARRAIEEALRAEKQRLSVIVENARDYAIFTTDTQSRITDWLPGAESVFGWTAEEAVGQRTAMLFTPEDREIDAPETELRTAREKGVAPDVRWHMRHDDTRVFIDGSMIALREPDGSLRGFLKIGQDVTERRAAEEHLRESEAALRRLNDTLEARVIERTTELMAVEAALRQSQKMEAIGQLTGGIAHDFNNMLQGIAGALDLMRRRFEQGRQAEAGHYVEIAQDTVRRAAALTHRLLAFARQQALNPVPVNLDELVRGMEELIRRTAGPAAQVEVRLGHAVHPVLCDESGLENALLNLCVNARDAMPDGGWLTISTEEVQLGADDLIGQEGVAPGLFATLAITDTGAGMDEATMARVFEPFFTTKPMGKGTGLGLSQVYGLVMQSGGFVRVESALGQGTTVRLFFPRHEEGRAPAQDDEAQAGAVVLLVEDEDSLRENAAEWLRDAGHRVLEAPDGAAALRLLHGGARVDVLVSDIGLPGGVNGRQVADAARESRPGLPVLLMTGYAAAALKTGLPAGMAIMDKPFALADLSERVKALLETARA